MGQGIGIYCRGWWRLCRKGRHALLPGGRELVDEGFDLVELPSMHLQERNPSGQKDVVHQQPIAHLALEPVSTAVVLIEFDGEHGLPVLLAADEEIDVALAEFEETGDGFVLEDVRKARLALNMAAVAG